MSTARQGTKVLFGAPNKRTDFATTYKTHYVPQPMEMYVPPKAWEDSTNNMNMNSKYGLGDEGKSFYQHTHVHLGDAYNRAAQETPRAKETHLGPRPWEDNGDWETSYQTLGKVGDVAVRPSTATRDVYSPRKGQMEQTEADYGLGEDGKTQYKATYKRPQTSGAYLQVSRVRGTDIDNPHGLDVRIDPYGPLCKSTVHEAFRAPPDDAYVVPSTHAAGQRIRTQDAGGRYGLGEFGATVYQDTFGRGPRTRLPVHAQPASRAGPRRTSATAYREHYPAPAVEYTGVGPNVARREAERRAARPARGAGLGAEAVTSYQQAHVHLGEAYRNRTAAELGATALHLAGAGAQVGRQSAPAGKWSTSYQNTIGVPPRGAHDPFAADRPPAAGPADTEGYGLGADARSSYTLAFPRPRTAAAAAGTARVWRGAVEGGGPAVHGEPYGPLCRSSAKLAWRRPPSSAYPRRPGTGARGPRAVVPVGTAGAEREYGLGRYGETTYQAEYTDKAGIDVAADAPPER